MKVSCFNTTEYVYSYLVIKAVLECLNIKSRYYLAHISRYSNCFIAAITTVGNFSTTSVYSGEL